MKRSTLENFYKNYCLYDEARRELEYMYNTYRSPRPEHYAPAANGPGTTDPVTAALHKLEDKRAELDHLEKKIFADLNEIEAWLDSSKDYQLNAILRERFIVGRSWRQTSYLVYRSKSAGTAATCYRRAIESGKIVFDPED